MSKITDFYAKAIEDEASRTELVKIIGDKSFEEATDEQLAQVGELAKKLGYDISVEEAKAYLNGDDAELDDDDLDAVAGGKGAGYEPIDVMGVGGGGSSSVCILTSPSNSN
jgi:hypothetical protein